MSPSRAPSWCGLPIPSGRCQADDPPRELKMTTTGVHEQQAAEFLARHDRVMANLMKRTGPFHLPRPSRGHFAALAESILHQQLAGAAVRAIHGRFVALFDGDLSPEAVLAVPPRKLRAAGLSGR